MHYNAAILSGLAAGISLISVSNAAPVQAREYTPQCPAGTQYVNYESTSGFKGCTSTPDAYKYGPRVYWGSCPPNHGNWYVCATGFSGCTTDSTVCDPKSTSPVPTHPECPAGQSYYVCLTGFTGCSADTTICNPRVDPPAGPPVNPGGCPAGQTYYNCATGFKGCSSDYTVCDPLPNPPIKEDPVYPGSCPTGQSYYNCATGFKGCSADTTVCDPPAPIYTPPVNTPTAPSHGLCPYGTTYVDYTTTSGFKGCTSTPANYAYGERKYWSSCPPAHGNWYVCANGFVGCNTYTAVCDLKAGESVPV